MSKEKRRPLNDEAFLELCDFIGEGGSLRAWAEKEGRTHGAIVRWILADESRNKAYREARKMQADAHIDQLIELADSPVPKDADGRTDSGAVQQLRVQIDTRKWVASKFYPALYGDRVAVDATFNGTEHKPDEILGRMTALLAAHGLKITTADPSDGTGEPR